MFKERPGDGLIYLEKFRFIPKSKFEFNDIKKNNLEYLESNEIEIKKKYVNKFKNMCELQIKLYKYFKNTKIFYNNIDNLEWDLRDILEKGKENSYIYLVTNEIYEKEGLYKIGKAGDICERFKKFKCFSPCKLIILGIRMCLDDDSAFKLEKVVQDYFIKDRIEDSEFFKFDKKKLKKVIKKFYNLKKGY